RYGVNGPNVTFTRATDPNRGYVSTEARNLSMGRGPQGNQVLYYGGGFWLYKTADGGATWKEIDGTAVMGSTPPDALYQNSALNPRDTTQIEADSREPHRLAYGDFDNFMLISNDFDPNAVTPAPSWQLQAPSALVKEVTGGNVTGDAATAIVTDP